MKEWLVFVSERAIIAIDMMALLIVIVGTVEAFVRSIGLLVSPGDSHTRHVVWLRYARWLVAALTFQLAADIIETSITTGWEALARIATIAVVRTFLNYFLEKDLAEVRERERETLAESKGATPSAVATLRPENGS